MPPPSIKSRPVYGKLAIQPGSSHLLVADAEGADAILELSASAVQSFLGVADIVYVVGKENTLDYPIRLRSLNSRSFQISPTIPAMLPRLGQMLATARMGLRVYLAGTEGLIGQAMKLAMDHGIQHQSITTEHRGSLERRVQCVHCKGINEQVKTQPVVCSHCGLILFVRDHYSRRIAAFQGVCIDAEEPGSAPTPQELFR